MHKKLLTGQSQKRYLEDIKEELSFPVDSQRLYSLLSSLPTSQYAVYPHHTSTTLETSKQVFTLPQCIDYSVYKIENLNNPRKNRRLVILELENVLCHMTGKLELDDRAIRRPHYETFFKRIYRSYDIIIWSAADPVVTKLMLKQLKMLEDKNFKILCCLDGTHTIPHHIQNLGIRFVKPLQLIWNKYPQYDQTNTVIVDYNVVNYNLNKSNGLKIKKYCRDSFNDDNELNQLSAYLSYLSNIGADISNTNMGNYSKF